MNQNQIFNAYAAYYDLLYSDKDYPAEAAYVRSLLSRHRINTGKLLDLGCGTGRHAEQFARRGYSVHGIDSSEAMIDIAIKKTPSELAKQLTFDVGDLRTARLGSQFDAVLALFQVASYQSTNEDLAEMFATASAHLKDDGVFVFDFWYGPAVLTERPAVRVKRLEDAHLRITRIAEPTLRPNLNLVDVRYTVFVTEQANGAQFELEETHRMRYLFLPELELFLRSAGLRVLNAERWLSGELGESTWSGVITAGKIKAP